LDQVYNIDKEPKFNNFFDYFKYGKNLINGKMEKQAGWILTPSHVLFLNGIINFYKPKKCLEIGVAEGGSSVLILNSLEKIIYIGRVYILSWYPFLYICLYN
jgi:hypothetical protein